MNQNEFLGFTFYFLFYNFIFYSFLGWIYETFLILFRDKKWVNRGFVNGPVIPIYGVGATLVYLILNPIYENAALVFLGGMFLATVLEFITSYLMEKLFHARWWDYSNIKYNIQGRVCLTASFIWGFMSILVAEVLQPIINRLIDVLLENEGRAISYVILLIFVTDLTVTVIYTFQLDKKLSDMQKLREEFLDYIETTKLRDVAGVLKNKLNESQITEWMEMLRQRLELDVKKRSHKEIHEKKKIYEEIDLRFKAFTSKYHRNTESKPFVLKRLLKAFPDIKSLNREYVLKDLKDKYLK